MKKANKQNTPEQIDFFDALIKRAKTGEHSKTEFIFNIKGASIALEYYKAMKKLIFGLRRFANSIFKDYRKSILRNTQSLDKLLAYTETQQCINFYLQEKAIAYDMIDEYVVYVTSGHILDTFLGIPRSERDLRDFRKGDQKDERK